MDVEECIMMWYLIRKNERRRTMWVHPIVEIREAKGAFTLIYADLEQDPSSKFFNYFRMSIQSFEELHANLECKLVKKDTAMRKSITPRERLAITLRFLATGESYQSLHYTFRVGQSTISEFIPVVTKAIYNNLKKDYLKVPNTAAQWLNISQEFYEKWNLPNVLGAMDGKHIIFRAPRSAGSAYYNYKQQHSIVLLAVVDADYKFLYVDCGTNDRISDGGVFQRSTLSAAISNNRLNFPAERPLPGRTMNVPFVLVADAAFPLSRNILKPFPFRNMTWPQRLLNYRLSRCRRVVENAFGIISNKWRVLLTVMNLSPAKVELITLTCCVLHNFLRVNCPLPCEGEDNAGIDRRFTFRYGLSQQGGNRPMRHAIDFSQEFMNYVVNEGQVPWQNDLT
ncbi:protein ALP1-like [Anoplophora glabripennis]|uniref:protein ALP1-like n=1 Tax=Anoplophora glabripennis TaxID=217634 RepID=UPI000874536D|nr:protein ALP1-like [Anoplophora glabripennis]